MIEFSDIMAIDTDHFELVEIREFFIVLHSRSTGHDWHLLEREANGYRTFLISHRHNTTAPFHPQKSRPSIEACCEYIKSHDSYQIKKNRKREARRRQRILAKYNRN